jgi:hypothetical protein
MTAEPDVRFDFTKPLAGWETVDGQWAIEEVPGAVRDKALVQRAINNSFNVIVAPGGPYADVDVSVRFKPISGREDASGGIVFRFADGRYYLIRANALEDNFNLYYFDRSAWFAFLTGGRFEITGANTKAPALGAWHALRIASQGDHIEGWVNGQRLIDHQDSRFAAGRVGLLDKGRFNHSVRQSGRAPVVTGDRAMKPKRHARGFCAPDPLRRMAFAYRVL